jgi:serine/threonine-protein kinase HipA
MADTETRQVYEVHLDAPELGAPARVGALTWDAAYPDRAATFEYDQTWLRGTRALILDPRLALYGGAQNPATDPPAFGIFRDCAPDRWGRMLLERREAAMATREQRPMRAFQDVDFLLGVHDHLRMGGLRFCRTGGPFLADSVFTAPPLAQLRELANLSARVDEPGAERLPDYETWLAMLIAAGAALGGSRPKANFMDDGERLWIAKFPAREDTYDVGAWEYLVHGLARNAGITLPDFRLDKLSERYSTFCASRFDRVAGGGRRMYASAMTLLERQERPAGASYLDLVEYLSDHGARGHIAEDLAQLFRRVVFNILVGNRDDHLRNHGFIREPSGWRLSPAFDMNPSPAKQAHALAIDSHDARPRVETALETCELYRLSTAQAKSITADVRTAISTWRMDAERLNLPAVDVRLMETVILA